jgi:hypothetical protein
MGCGERSSTTGAASSMESKAIMRQDHLLPDLQLPLEAPPPDGLPYLEAKETFHPLFYTPSKVIPWWLPSLGPPCRICSPPAAPQAYWTHYPLHVWASYSNPLYCGLPKYAAALARLVFSCRDSRVELIGPRRFPGLLGALSVACLGILFLPLSLWTAQILCGAGAPGVSLLRRLRKICSHPAAPQAYRALHPLHVWASYFYPPYCGLPKYAAALARLVFSCRDSRVELVAPRRFPGLLGALSVACLGILFLPLSLWTAQLLCGSGAPGVFLSRRLRRICSTPTALGVGIVYFVAVETQPQLLGSS